MSKLTLSFNNGKIKATAREFKRLGKIKSLNQVACFDLPAGHTCPAANLCKSTVNRDTGIRSDFGDFVCYATKAECLYPSVRKMRWNNYDALKSHNTVNGMVDLILQSLPNEIKYVRIHSSGDFFNRMYFNAWIKVCQMRPELTVYGYTKILPYVTAQKPDNFCLVYSVGGLFDDKLDKNTPHCKVVCNESDNPDNLDIICQDKSDFQESLDFEYITSGKSFGLNLH